MKQEHVDKAVVSIVLNLMFPAAIGIHCMEIHILVPVIEHHHLVTEPADMAVPGILFFDMCKSCYLNPLSEGGLRSIQTIAN